MTDVLVISGPAGVGKSVVAFEMSLQLRAAAIPHALIDTDELDRIYPVPDDLPSVTERNLAAVWGTFSERGIDRLILVGVHLTRPQELEWIARAIPQARFTLVRLQASDDTLLDRVRRREIGTGMAAQWERTRAQAASHAAESSRRIHEVSTDVGSVIEIAQEVVELWLKGERRRDSSVGTRRTR